MWPLFLENCRYVLRSRMVFLILLFSTMAHYSGLKLMNHLTLSIQEVVTVIGPKQAIQVALYLQLFTALSIAAVYGIWMAPYPHRGDRGLLTHMIPLSKLKFPLCYLLVCGLLLVINQFVLYFSFGWVMGFSSLAFKAFPWATTFRVFLFQTLCLEVLMLFLACSSLILGQVVTVFLGSSSLFVMQIFGILSRSFSQELSFSEFSIKGLFVSIYERLPPVGNFIFDFYHLSKGEAISNRNLFLWVVWLLIFNLLFWLKIRYPTQMRSTES